MVFQVYDQGNRIQTPWNEIFPPKTVSKLEATAATHKPSLQDELKEGSLPHELRKPTAEGYRKVREGISDPEQITRAHQIMRSPVITLPQNFTLDQAWKTYQRYGFRHFPVVDDNKGLVGMVSDRDLLKATSTLAFPVGANAKANLGATPLERIMIRKVLTATPDIHVRELAAVMIGHHIGSMLFVDQNRQVMGILTRSDILRTLVHHAPIELWI